MFHSTNGKVQGGQLEAAVGTAAEAAKLLGAHGGEIRFFLTLAGGEDVNGTLFSQEYESAEALATAFDALADDVELQALLSRLSAPGSPTMITSQSMGMEMPLGRTRKRAAAASSRSTPATSTPAELRMQSPKRRRSARSSSRMGP